jgi:hypothetical protein
VGRADDSDRRVVFLSFQAEAEKGLGLSPLLSSGIAAQSAEAD